MPSSDKSHPSRRTSLFLEDAWVWTSFRNSNESNSWKCAYEFLGSIHQPTETLQKIYDLAFEKAITNSKEPIVIIIQNVQCSMFGVAMLSVCTPLATAICDARDYIKLQSYKCYMLVPPTPIAKCSWIFCVSISMPIVENIHVARPVASLFFSHLKQTHYIHFNIKSEQTILLFCFSFHSVFTQYNFWIVGNRRLLCVIIIFPHTFSLLEQQRRKCEKNIIWLLPRYQNRRWKWNHVVS